MFVRGVPAVGSGRTDGVNHKLRIAAALSMVLLAFATLGCGGSSSDSEAEVKELATRFASAIDQGDYAEVCDKLFSDFYKSSLGDEGLDVECKDLQGPGSLGSPALKGLVASGVAINESSATVRFLESPVYLKAALLENGEWRIIKIAESG